MKGRTTIVVAHRLSTVVSADRIVVMDRGRVVEEGSHKELMARPEGLYARLHQLGQAATLDDWWPTANGKGERDERHEAGGDGRRRAHGPHHGARDPGDRGRRAPGALEREGSPHLGQDAGELAGVGRLGVGISADPLPPIAHADGIIDFSTPEATVANAGYAAQARIVHVIGTTGCSGVHEEAIKAAARHATIVKSGNMSLGVNLLAVLVEQAARALSSEFDIEILEMHHRHKVDAPSGTALLLGEAAAAGRAIALDKTRYARATATPARGRKARSASPRCAAARWWASIPAIFAGPAETLVLSHKAEDRAIFANGA
jgi:4-hydroxy-tetrahydrodipicolinate reductase